MLNKNLELLVSHNPQFVIKVGKYYGIKHTSVTLDMMNTFSKAFVNVYNECDKEFNNLHDVLTRYGLNFKQIND